MVYLFSFFLFLLLLLVYFRLAQYYQIVDFPNERSSHRKVTIIGAGVIFIVSLFIAGMLHVPQYNIAVLATMLVGGVSFIDDRIPLPRSLRLLFQFFAVSLLFYQLHIYIQIPIWATLLLFVLMVGTINAYNFLDGINGMTGLYSLIVLGALQYVNFKVFHFIEPDMIWFPMEACGVFLIFNFRKRARCFAGDVGSITMAAWVIFLLLKLMFDSGTWTYMLFLSVYGIESVLTISHRLLRKEDIFKPHRIHFFQLLSNEAGWPQLLVSSIYVGVQIVSIAALLWLAPDLNPFLLTALILIPPGAVYILVKPHLMKLKKAHQIRRIRKLREMENEVEIDPSFINYN